MKRRKYSLANEDFTTAIYFDNEYYTLSSFELESIDGNISSYAGAGQAGTTITNRQYGSRDATITGYVLADDEDSMRARKSQLQKLTAPTSDFHIIINGKYKMRLTAKASIEYKSEHYVHNEYLTLFTIEAVAANPFFEPMNEVDAELSGWIKDFHFPFHNPIGERFTFGHKAPSKIIELENKGEVETGMVITFTAINGTVKNPALQNIDTQEKLEISKVLQSGESIEISTTYGNKYVRNADTKENWLKYLSVQSDFLQMPIGVSNFKYSYNEDASTGTLKCVCRYTPKLFEV